MFVWSASEFFSERSFFVILQKINRMKILQEVEKHIKIDAEIERFFYEECETRTIEKGKLLSEQNHYNRNIYFVEEGMLRMFYYENGKDITSNFYSEGKITANIDTIFKKCIYICRNFSFRIKIAGNIFSIFVIKSSQHTFFHKIYISVVMILFAY